MRPGRYKTVALGTHEVLSSALSASLMGAIEFLCQDLKDATTTPVQYKRLRLRPELDIRWEVDTFIVTLTHNPRNHHKMLTVHTPILLAAHNFKTTYLPDR